MGMQVGSQEGIRAEINVVPLIDIVLVLLIIFMVVTPMLQKGIPVQLPEGHDPAKKPDSKDDVILSVKFEGDNPASLFLTGEEAALSEDAVNQKLADLNERAPSTPVYIKADKRLTYGAVKKVMLMCEAAGFKSISLVAEAPK